MRETDKSSIDFGTRQFGPSATFTLYLEQKCPHKMQFNGRNTFAPCQIVSFLQNTPMKYSIKPFLLDSILTWANANRCTPIVTAKAHHLNKLPVELFDEKRMSFNLSQKAVARKTISTDGVTFSAHLLHDPNHPQEVFLSTDSLETVRIKETGHILYLDFVENISQDNFLWPSGLLLSQGDAENSHQSDRATLFQNGGILAALSGNSELSYGDDGYPDREVISKDMSAEAPEHTASKKHRHLRIVSSEGNLI